jgi:hypothetical protein
MKIVVKTKGGLVNHAALYNTKTKDAKIYCSNQKYFAVVTDFAEPTKENVTCKKCLNKL